MRPFSAVRLTAAPAVADPIRSAGAPLSHTAVVPMTLRSVPATWLRARRAICRTAAGLLPTASATPSNGTPNTSRSTNTARSVGRSVSRTASIAIETLSASSTSSATSGWVSRGSGGHSPTYSSRRRESVRRRLSAWRVTARTR